jgi:glycosyltransferase involved in cell wall biosynthesis
MPFDLQRASASMGGKLPRVVFLNPWERVIGPNRYLLELLRHSTPEVLSNTTVVFNCQTDALDEYRQLGIRVEVWPELQPVFLNVSFRNVIRLFRLHTSGFVRFVYHLRRLRPEVLISNTEMLFVSQWAARVLGIPHLQIFHAISFQYRLGNHPRLLRLYLKIMQAGSYRLIGVSQTLVAALIKGGVPPHKVALIANPVSAINRMAENGLPPELLARLERHSPILVTAGKTSPMKGQDLLVEALPLVRAQFPDLLCIFVGGIGASDGADDTIAFAARVQQRVAQYQLSDHVMWLDAADYLPALLKRADLYVQPSRTESFGRVVAEALLGGTPVVAFEVGALPEVVGPGGILVPFPDTERMAGAICELLHDSERRMALATQGKQHILKNYEAGLVAGEFRRLLATSAVDTH